MEEQLLTAAAAIESDCRVIEALESRLVNAWPSFETQVVDGWLIRFANGYSKRANSASPMREGAALDEDAIGHIVHQFQARRLRPVFRLTGLETPETDDLLAERGFAEFEPSLCLIAPTARAMPDAAIHIEPAASPAWIEAAAASYGGEKADHATLGAIVSRITQTAAFATISDRGRDIGWALAVAERGHVGLYDIVVAPDTRGRGLGRRLVKALIGWGAAAGADRAYLQVREDNAAACTLYASLGFMRAYRYRHRVGPAPA